MEADSLARCPYSLAKCSLEAILTQGVGIKAGVDNIKYYNKCRVRTDVKGVRGKDR